MEKPVEPNDEDCCNNGCKPCIFDIYEKRLKLYKKFKETGEYTDSFSQENGISQLKYTRFFVIENINLCKNHNLIKFKKAVLDGKKVRWKASDHFFFKYSINETTYTRAYTPFTVKNKPTNVCDFAIIVKKYENGIVSNYLFNLNEGSTTLWRGPYGQYDLEENKFNKIIMIAQGTGITVFIDIIDSILNNEDDVTKIILLYCCKCIETILFRDELYAYKSYWNFCYDIYVNCDKTTSKVKYQEPIKYRKLCTEDIINLTHISDNDQFLICGSTQFNDTIATNIRKEMPLIKNIVLF